MRRTDSVKTMLDRAQIDSEERYYNFLLFCAIQMNNAAAMKLLLDAGAELGGLDLHDESALYKAAVRRDEPLVKRLMDNGVEVIITGGSLGTALQSAISG